MKLNLGGRDKPIQGFKTVDRYDGADINCDISKLDCVESGSVEELYASHCLEHFSHTKTIEVLKEWRRVLRPNAKAYIAVPDFDAVVSLYQKFGMNAFLRNFLFGDQGYDLAYHYTAFTFPTLAAALVESGFSDVKRISKMPYGLRDCSTLVDTFTQQPMSLNVEAIA